MQINTLLSNISSQIIKIKICWIIFVFDIVKQIIYFLILNLVSDLIKSDKYRQHIFILDALLHKNVN